MIYLRNPDTFDELELEDGDVVSGVEVQDDAIVIFQCEIAKPEMAGIILLTTKSDVLNLIKTLQDTVERAFPFEEAESTS